MKKKGTSSMPTASSGGHNVSISAIFACLLAESGSSVQMVERYTEGVTSDDSLNFHGAVVS